MAAIASLVVLVFLTLSAGILHIPAVREFALERGQGYLLDQRDIDLESSNFDYNLFTGSSTLENVVIRSPEAPPGAPPFFTARRVEVNLGLTNLIAGVFDVQQARIVDGQVQVVYDAQGRSNVPNFGGKQGNQNSGGGSPFKFVIEDFRGSGPLLRYADLEAKREVAIHDWSLAIKGQNPGGPHTISFSTQNQGELTLDDQRFPLRITESEMRLTPADLQIDALALRVGASNVRVQGSIKNLDDPIFDLTTSGRIKLADWAELAGYEQLQGDAEFSGTVKRRWARLLADLKVTATDLGLDPQARAEMTLNYSRADERVALPDLTLTSTRGRFDGNATLFFDDSQTSTASGAFERLDTAFFSRLFDSPYVVASRASGRLQASWPGLEFKQATAQGQATLQAAAQEPREGFLPASGSVRFSRGPAGGIDATLSGLQALGAAVSGRATVASGGQLNADLQASMDDLGRTVHNVRVLTGSAQPDDERQPLEGPASLTASLSGTIDNPQADVTFRSDNLRAGPIENMALDAKAAASKAAVDFQSITARWQERTFHASGRLGFEGESPSLDFTATADRFPAEALAAVAGSEDAGVTGEVSLDASVNGTIAAPEASFQVSIDGLHAYNEDWGRLAADGRFIDARLVLNDLTINKPDAAGTIQASGSYDIDAKSANVELAARQFTLQHLNLPGAPTIQGTINLEGTASGTLDNPTAQATLQASNLEVGDFAAGDISGDASLSDQSLKWNLAAPAFGFEGSGQGPLTAPYPVEFQATLTNFQPAKFRPGLPPSTVSGQVSGTVPLSDPEQADVTAELSRTQVEAAGQQIVNAEPIRFSYRDRSFDIESLTLQTSQGKLSASGILPLEGETTQGLKIDGNFSLELIRLLTGKGVDELFLLGLAEIHGGVTGSIKQPKPDINITLEDAVILSPAMLQPVINADITAHAGEDGIELQSVDAEWTRAHITGQGLVPYPLIGVDFIGSGDLDQPARLQAKLEGLNLDVLEIGPNGFGGQASADLNLEAAQLEPDAITGSLVLPSLTLHMRELALKETEPATIRLEGGAAHIESFNLEGPESKFVVSGDVKYAPEVAFDLRADIEADAGIANYIVEEATFRGPAELHATIQGTPDDPRLDGSFTLTNGGFAIPDPQVAAEDLQVQLALSRDKISIEKFTGILNGGDFEASGDIGIGEDFAILPDLEVKASEMFLEPIQGLRTATHFDLKFTSPEKDRNLLTGDFVIEEGSYRENLDLQAQLGTFLRSTNPVLIGEPNPFLEKLHFEVNVRTENPIVVDNNLAQLEASLDVRLVGTYYRPSLLGRATLEEGGEVRLAENRYVIDQGMVEFTNENRIHPDLTLTALTEVAGHEITLRATGPLDDLDTQLTSDSGLSEPDIVSLLVTGRTLDQARESGGMNIAREQALSFLAGTVGSGLSQRAESSLGLTEVRIEPNLISGEEDPSARLTIGQRITRQLELIYSMNLTDSNDQIFITEYDINRRFNARAVKQSDNSYRLDFRHDLRFGLGNDRQESKNAKKKTIRKIEIAGDPKMTEAEVLDTLGIKAGDKFDFFQIRRKIDKLEKRYRKEDRLQAHVRLRRQEEGDQVDLNFKIDAGPKVQFVFFPDEPPGGVRGDVRQAWSDGVFETQRLDDAKREVLSWLVSEHYYEAEINASVEQPEADVSRVNINIEKGVRFNELEIRFPGAAGIEPDDLRRVLDAVNLSQRLRARPREAEDALKRYYSQNGYLDAEIERPDMQLDADTGSAIGTIAVKEGPLYHVGGITFTGVVSLDLQTLERTLAVETGHPAYTPEYLRQATRTIEEYYWDRGFNDVVVNFLLTRRPSAGLVDIEFQVEEGKQDIVREINISGNKFVSTNFIRRRLVFDRGQGLTPDVADRSRRRLYKTQAFALVDFNKEPIEFEGAPPTENSLRVNLGVREVPPYRIRYGGFYDTDRGPGAILDVDNRNVLGSARWLGLRARYDSNLKEGRLYFNQPLLHGLPIQTTSSLYRSREYTDLFITDRTGASVQEEVEFRRRFIWNYGYRYERTRTFERNPDPLFPFDVTVDVAPLTSSLTFDSRDSLLDATRGRFISQAFEYAPATLGSDVRYIKYFGQYFDYYSLIDAKPQPFETKPQKPRLLYAGGVRLGLAKGLGGQDLIVSERFLAGGGTTVRGFQQDKLGPQDIFGNALGGDAVFVVNNELRFPLVSVFEGVSFVDLGNVYEKAADFNPTDVRATAGLGLRLRTPFFLLRADYGWKLDRKPGESSGAFFFSIGQAF